MQSDYFTDYYNTLGVDGYYSRYGAKYRNPHDADIRRALSQALDKWRTRGLNFSNVCDLACGSGEVTLALREYFQKRSPELLLSITATDPYTHEGNYYNFVILDGWLFFFFGQENQSPPHLLPAFKERTGLDCDRISFEDIEAGALIERRFDCIFCSFALHLVKEDRLLTVCVQLAIVSPHLIIISPHKKPHIESEMGWNLTEEVLY
jgi:hypothetical protein